MHNAPTPITFDALRGRGFRLREGFADFEPHMRIEISRAVDTYLEIGRCGVHRTEWTCWIVCEMSHRYGRFCFLRDVQSIEQVNALYFGLTDNDLPVEDYDASEFAEGVRMVREWCEKAWNAYSREDLRRHILVR